MSEKNSLGQELVDAVSEALNSTQNGRVIRVGFNVKELRHKLRLTQREFSTQYHINIETLRNWEQEKRIPDLTSIAFLTCIEKNPQIIYELLNNN
jgi:putative transcriptional regulator